jgi:HK97 family phage prohead protease
MERRIKMTNPITKKMNQQHEYRNVLEFELRAIDDNNDFDNMYVEGYAAKYDSPTVLFEMDGIEYKEVIDRNAFIEADLSDVIFNYNHKGKVLARTRNKTLELRTDDTGLYFRAKLGGTIEGREMYNLIKNKYVDRMSFRFEVREDSYDSNTHTRRILKFKLLRDISAVDFPAYDDTSVSARGYFNAQEEIIKLKDEEERKRKITILKTFL